MTATTRVAHPTLVVCVALLVGGCAAGQRGGTTPPTATFTASDEGSVPPSPSVRPLRATGGTAILEPGAYVLDLFPVNLAFDIPDGDPPGWHVGKSSSEVAVVLWYTPPEIGYGFAFWSAENIYADPCSPAAGELEPPIGPSVEDFVAALSSLPQFQVTAPVDVTVGGFQGKQIELTALESGFGCRRVIPWIGADDTVQLNAGDTFRVNILDVDGVRIVMHSENEVAESDAAVEAELQQILDSIRIEPLS